MSYDFRNKPWIWLCFDGCKVQNKYSLNVITYAKTQINKIIVTGFINEKDMHGAIIEEIYVFFHSTMKL